MSIIQPFLDAQEQRTRELAELRRAGRKVIGFFCLHTPAVLIEAAGGIPVRLCLQGDSFVQRRGEVLGRSCICPFIKACLGHLEQRHPLFAQVDAIAAGSMCDQIRHLADIWRSRFHKPAYVFFQPRGLEQRASGWIYRRELRWLFAELAAFCGGDTKEQELKEIIARYNLINWYLSVLHELRAEDVPPITGKEWLAVVGAGFMLASGHYLHLLRSLIEGIARGKGRCRGTAVRIMLAGGMLAQGDDRLVQTVEEGGAVVVTDALCTGTRVMGSKIAVQGNLLDNIIDAHRGKTPCIHARPNDGLYAYIDRQLKQFRVDGVIYHGLKFCEGWGSEWVRMQQFLKGRGVLNIVLDTDYGATDAGQLATRIGAFLEMLRAQKEGMYDGVL